MNQYGTKRLSSSFSNGFSGIQGSNESKKLKLDGKSAVSSPVVHIRSIPHDATEAEVVQLGIPFGRVENVLVLKGKNQAFLQMTHEDDAVRMVIHYSDTPALINGHPVYMQFSNHRELKTGSSMDSGNDGLLEMDGSFGQSSAVSPKAVLRVIIQRMLYPVTLDALHQVFSRVGDVEKIITFTRNNTFQALIQYPDDATAEAAKMNFDGKNIYSGCCTLHVEHSKLTHLNVKYNDDKSRDYTKPDMPLEESLLGSPTTAINVNLMRRSAEGIGSAGMSLMGAGPGAGTIGGTVGSSFMPQPDRNCVLIVSNLDKEMVTPDALFTLFGVYGDVQRVKILYNKKDNALVQMNDSSQAQLAITNLDRVIVWGKPIRVSQSKFQSVQLPRDDHHDDGLAKDYSGSKLHRFKKPGSRNAQNISSPSSTLHLSNLPESLEEEEVKEAFETEGFEVVDFRFFQKNKKMALIELASVADAVMALIKMHNAVLEGSHLRVSFSKSPI